MNRILVICMLATAVIGCTHKPPLPNGLNHKSSAKKEYSKNSRPPLPYERIPEKKKVVKVSTDNSNSSESMSPSDIFEKYSSAVFKIYTSTGVQGFQGSGFFISGNGIAVSNYHVFEGTAIGYEKIILSDGRQLKVSKVFHKNKENDFIIFKVDINSPVNYIPLASSTPKVGEKIYTIGSPRGLDNTFSSGEISQIRDNGDILQISAPIDHGSSGGVLLNNHGQAIGITSGGIDDSGANLNYARNINLIKSYLP